MNVGALMVNYMFVMDVGCGVDVGGGNEGHHSRLRPRRVEAEHEIRRVGKQISWYNISSGLYCCLFADTPSIAPFATTFPIALAWDVVAALSGVGVGAPVSRAAVAVAMTTGLDLSNTVSNDVQGDIL